MEPMGEDVGIYRSVGVIPYVQEHLRCPQMTVTDSREVVSSNWEATLPYIPQTQAQILPFRRWNLLLNSNILYQLINQYDMPPALAGVASLFDARMGGCYYAGLWGLDFRTFPGNSELKGVDSEESTKGDDKSNYYPG
jgi:hypothetical protein